jgi:hypothetical protein
MSKRKKISSREPPIFVGTSAWVCEVCGCTDTTPCATGRDLPGGVIETCSWVRKNLCSTCAEKQKVHK